MIRMPRLNLAPVTLCAVDTRAPALALQSLQRSMAEVDFARVLLFTHDWQPSTAAPGIEIVDIGPIASGAAYSQFVLQRLPALIDSSHVLITQWDGFIVHPAAWTDEFLAHDYVGAVWPDKPEGRNVGNGGFSLRSRRLLDAGATLGAGPLHPEDHVLCALQRERLEREQGLRFAPSALARRFAFENEAPRQPTFGFHGPYHLPRFLDARTLASWLDAMPDPFFCGRDARRLARALLARRMPGVAAQLLQRRRAAGRNDANTRLLSATAAMLRLFAPHPG